MRLFNATVDYMSELDFTVRSETGRVMRFVDEDEASTKDWVQTFAKYIVGCINPPLIK